jgi:hypothetical protein
MAMMTPDRAKKLNSVKPADLKLARNQTDEALKSYDGSKQITVIYDNSVLKTVKALADMYSEHWAVSPIDEKLSAPYSLTFGEKVVTDPAAGMSRGPGEK